MFKGTDSDGNVLSFDFTQEIVVNESTQQKRKVWRKVLSSGRETSPVLH